MKANGFICETENKSIGCKPSGWTKFMINFQWIQMNWTRNDEKKFQENTITFHRTKDNTQAFMRFFVRLKTFPWIDEKTHFGLKIIYSIIMQNHSLNNRDGKIHLDVWNVRALEMEEKPLPSFKSTSFTVVQLDVNQLQVDCICNGKSEREREKNTFLNKRNCMRYTSVLYFILLALLAHLKLRILSLFVAPIDWISYLFFEACFC